MHIFRKMHADWMTEEYIFITKMHSVYPKMQAKYDLIIVDPRIRLAHRKDCLPANSMGIVTMH